MKRKAPKRRKLVGMLAAAKSLGVSKQALHLWKQSGMPSPECWEMDGDTYKYDVEACKAWRAANFEKPPDAAFARKKQNQPPEPAKSGGVSVPDYSGLTTVKLRAKIEALTLAKLQMEADELSGKLIEKESVRRTWVNALTRMRRGVLAVVPRVLADLGTTLGIGNDAERALATALENGLERALIDGASVADEEPDDEPDDGETEERGGE